MCHQQRNYKRGHRFSGHKGLQIGFNQTEKAVSRPILLERKPWLRFPETHGNKWEISNDSLYTLTLTLSLE